MGIQLKHGYALIMCRLSSSSSASSVKGWQGLDQSSQNCVIGGSFSGIGSEFPS